MYDTSNRNLFISRALNSLKKKNLIELDISKNTYKDFLIAKVLIKMIDSLLNKNVTGTFNLSSNIPIKVYDIFRGIIKGYGRGKIAFQKESFFVDSFRLV